LRHLRRKTSKPIVCSGPIIAVERIFAPVEEKKFDPGCYCPFGFAGKVWRVDALIELRLKLKK